METKYQVVSSLVNGLEPKAIALELDVPYTKVLRIKREYEQAVANDELASFIDMDKVVMGQLLDGITEQAPVELQEAVDGAVTQIKEAKTILDALNDDMVVTAKQLTTRIKSMSATIEHVSELEGLVSALATLNDSFFKDSRTQVNIQNNMGGESPAAAYGEFLSD